MSIRHLQSIWRFRHFVGAAIHGEMKARFASSRIGMAWHVLHPLAMAAIYALVLSKVLGAKLGGVDNEAGYAIFLISGIAIWSLFSEIMNRCLMVFIEYGGKLKKISFPRSALPVIVLGGATITHLLLLVAVIVVFATFNHWPSWHWLALPLGFVVAAMLGLGLGLLLGTFNVFSRDVLQVMTVILNLWFWLTPIVYPIEIVPEGLQLLIAWNPMTPLVAYYQDVMLFGVWPDPTMLTYPAVLALVLCGLAFFVFRRASEEIVDVL